MIVDKLRMMKRIVQITMFGSIWSFAEEWQTVQEQGSGGGGKRNASSLLFLILEAMFMISQISIVRIS